MRAGDVTASNLPKFPIETVCDLATAWIDFVVFVGYLSQFFCVVRECNLVRRFKEVKSTNWSVNDSEMPSVRSCFQWKHK